MNAESVFLCVLLPLQAVAALLAGWRVLVGPHIADRVVALELLATIAVAMSATLAIGSGTSAFVDVALVLALISFLGTVAFATLLDRGSRHV